MQFSKLFKKSDTRIADLQKTIETNATEKQWAMSFNKRREDMESELRLARDNFSMKPSDAGAEKCIELAREINSLSGHSEILAELSKLAWDVEKPRQTARLREVISPALDAVLEALQSELSRIEQSDLERADALAVSAADVRSPVRDRLQAAIDTGERFKTAIADGDDTRIQPAISFVLRGHTATPAAIPDVPKGGPVHFPGERFEAPAMK